MKEHLLAYHPKPVPHHSFLKEFVSHWACWLTPPHPILCLLQKPPFQTQVWAGQRQTPLHGVQTPLCSGYLACLCSPTSVHALATGWWVSSSSCHVRLLVLCVLYLCSHCSFFQEGLWPTTCTCDICWLITTAQGKPLPSQWASLFFRHPLHPCFDHRSYNNLLCLFFTCLNPTTPWYVRRQGIQRFLKFCIPVA